jgi:hypothetical protein
MFLLKSEGFLLLPISLFMITCSVSLLLIFMVRIPSYHCMALAVFVRMQRLDCTLKKTFLRVRFYACRAGITAQRLQLQLLS